MKKIIPIKRKGVRDSVVKKLYALSLNKCYNPNCLNIIVDSDGAQMGEIAHIEAYSQGGSRYNSNDDNKNRYYNLIVLCENCHGKIDQLEEKYSVEELLRWKSSREEESFKFNIRKKSKIISEDKQLKKIVSRCFEKYDLEIDEDDCNRMIYEYQNLNDIERDVLNEIIEYTYPQLNLNDINNRYENLDYNEYIHIINRLYEKKFIDDNKYYTYVDQVNFMQYREIQYRFIYGIWVLSENSYIYMEYLKVR